jgi:hypothetical protein
MVESIPSVQILHNCFAFLQRLFLLANEEGSSFACLSVSLNSPAEPLHLCLSFRGRGFAALIEEV